MNRIQDAKYNIMVKDLVVLCGELVTEVPQVSLENTLTFIISYTIDKNCGQLPVPHSYVLVMGELMDNMTFIERVKICHCFVNLGIINMTLHSGISFTVK